MRIYIYAVTVLIAAMATSSYADSCCPAALKGAKLASLPDRSLYHLEGAWTVHTGTPATLATFAGKPTLLTMFFASCGYACPILIEDVRALINSLPQDLHDDFNVVMLSFDTERDTPEALAKFARERRLPAPPWSLLHGDADVVLETSALLGVNFRKDTEGNFAHSNIITLLDANGVIVHQLEGLRADASPLKAALQKELAVTSSTPVAKESQQP